MKFAIATMDFVVFDWSNQFSSALLRWGDEQINYDYDIIRVAQLLFCEESSRGL